MVNLISENGLLSSTGVVRRADSSRLTGTGGGSMRPAVGLLGLLAVRERVEGDIVEQKLSGGVDRAYVGVGSLWKMDAPRVG